MDKQYWSRHYKENDFPEESGFANFVLPWLEGSVVDLGCGSGRDMYFFRKKGHTVFGVDAANEDFLILKQDLTTFIKNNPVSPDNVYTRFFWHAISAAEQKEILGWAKKRLFIEARTTKDKPKDLYGKHSRRLVNTEKLKKNLKDYGFEILHFSEGYGKAPHLGEDPHIVRVVAEKT